GLVARACASTIGTTPWLHMSASLRSGAGPSDGEVAAAQPRGSGVCGRNGSRSCPCRRCSQQGRVGFGLPGYHRRGATPDRLEVGLSGERSALILVIGRAGCVPLLV